ncbi:MAG: glycosyltransferase family 4 protein [Gammaproteobacteria bacterium]|nr:glycosyltransferase family 4 protein [Gammaproteobacteria bacterium]
MERTINVAIFSTHPIQYYVPWFRLLHSNRNLESTVLYNMIPNEDEQGVGFGVNIKWDIPIMEGYKWGLVKNVATNKGVSSFFGCVGWGISKAIKRIKPDVAIVTGWNAFYLIQCLFLAKLFRIPIILRGESNVKKKRGYVASYFQYRIIKMADAFLYIGQSNKELYEHYGINADQMFEAPYFVDSDLFEKENSIQKNEKKEGVCFIFVGKFIPKKRPLDFLNLIVKLKKEGRAVRGIMVGDGELRSEIEDAIKRENIDVLLAGFVNQRELRGYYENADIFVLPSDSGETWGLVTNEAMLSGLPVLVSDQVGCVQDLVDSGVTGFSYPCGQIDKMLKQAKVMIDECDLAKMGENSLNLVKTKFTPEKTYQATLQAIGYLLKN